MRNRPRATGERRAEGDSGGKGAGAGRAPLTYLAKKDFCSWGFLAFWACSISRRSMKAAVSGLGVGGEGERVRGWGSQRGHGKASRRTAETDWTAHAPALYLHPGAPAPRAHPAHPHPGAVAGGCSCTEVLNSSRSTSSTSCPLQPPGCVTTDTPTTLPATSTCRVSWSERCDSTREHWGGGQGDQGCHPDLAHAKTPKSPTPLTGPRRIFQSPSWVPPPSGTSPSAKASP